MKRRRSAWLRASRALLGSALLACTALLACGAPRPGARAGAAAARGTGSGAGLDARSTWQAAQRVFDARCVVCHGCYDAPCQLQLGTFEGIARGASTEEVYDGSRLLAIEPTRLFVDAHGAAAWRERGFHTVLPERDQQDPRHSLLVRMLQLKRAHPLPPGPVLSDEDFDLGLDRAQVCTEQDDFDDFAEEHPLWGMPYALPALTEAEHATLLAWVEAGAPHADEPPPSREYADAIERWEQFLNERSPKARLSARYIYEHLFLATLYFDDAEPEAGARRFFRLVRSRTPPGRALDEIATRRPFDDPGVREFYYRLVPRSGAPLLKTHMPYALSDARLARFRALFLEPSYRVNKLPSYEPELSANPFKAFRALPVRARYRFMLEEAEFTMMGFIKGPVCRGQIALNVIQERFWITFVNPDVPWLDAEAEFLAKHDDDLDLPAESGSNARLLSWFGLARKQRRFLRVKSEFLDKLARQGTEISLGAIWNGDGANPNAALTVLRHYDSATVVKGLVGGPPKTSWVVGYSLLERIHYLLVAGFDVFGNLGHQLNTRMYMDFLRMEGEYNFLLLLPPARRHKLVENWYRGVSDSVKDEVYGQLASFDHPPDIPYRSDTPELELFELQRDHLAAALSTQYELSQLGAPALREDLERLSGVSGVAASLFPEVSLLAIEARDGSVQYASLLRESEHTNVAQLFGEDARRLPEQDRLTVVDGFLGAYPNALFLVAREELSAFVSAAAALRDEAGYLKLRERFGVLRTSRHFWSHSDRMHEAARALDPLRAGLLDFNRLDPR
jgi:Fatty acid cis/trans isomerase (CTI)